MVFAVICMPQLFFYGLYTVFGQVLNADGRFAAFTWAPVLANVVAIGRPALVPRRRAPARPPPRATGRPR